MLGPKNGGTSASKHWAVHSIACQKDIILHLCCLIADVMPHKHESSCLIANKVRTKVHKFFIAEFITNTQNDYTAAEIVCFTTVMLHVTVIRS